MLYSPDVPPIDRFSCDDRWLSNFWITTVYMDGQRYLSVEHAYQAAKTLDSVVRAQFTAPISPGDAKRLGRTIELRPDWEQVRNQVMLGLTWDKYTRNRALADKLLDTGLAYLAEGNTWGDEYWGVCNGAGRNQLGITIMYVRAILRNLRQG
jgi:ribA/ribD-fused uncharacterized protein